MVEENEEEEEDEEKDQHEHEQREDVDEEEQKVVLTKNLARGRCRSACMRPSRRGRSGPSVAGCPHPSK